MQGNLLSTYSQTANIPSPKFEWEEQHLYGSSRLGLLRPAVSVYLSAPKPHANYNDTMDVSGDIGRRVYELTNHLGNVMATISDKRLSLPDLPACSLGCALHYEAEILSAQDYYPGGMQMPGRKYGSMSRYGFNGKEQDPEVSGEGTQYDYGFRIYDPRLVRFKSVDPLTKSYPHFTPYQFSSNNPILNVDLDGLEGVDYLKNIVVKLDGNSAFPQSDLKNTSYHEIFLVMNGKTANIIHSTPNGVTKIEFNPSSAPGGLTMGVRYAFTQLIATREWSKGWVRFTDNDLPSMIKTATGTEQNAAGFANTFRHYSWQSLLTAGFGKGFAKDIGDYHEADGLGANKPKGSYIKDNIIDIVNNHYAREYGAGIDFDKATSSIENFVDYLNGVAQHIASTVDGYKDDKAFDGIRTGKVKMFDKNNKAIQREYSTLQGIKNEREKNKEAEKKANEPVSTWGN